MNTIIYITDARQKYLARYLPGKKLADTKENLFANAQRVILPTPVSKMNTYPFEAENLRDELEKNPKIRVYGGKFTEEWLDFFAQHQIAYYDLMKDEKVAMENAYVTAEATVAVILQNSLYSIRNEKVVVTGYGRCGKAVSDLLAAMGAKVTVLARSHEARRQARCDGHNAADFSYGPEEACSSRILINTVPAMVVTEKIIREMNRSSLIIDISSSPGGCDLKAIEKYQIPYKLALGLPGIYTVKSSAKILAQAIERDSNQFAAEHVGLVEKNQGKNVRNGEERAWIFQIVL